MLALTGKPRLWGPRRLRLRLFSTPPSWSLPAAAASSALPTTGHGTV